MVRIRRKIEGGGISALHVPIQFPVVVEIYTVDEVRKSEGL